MEYKAFGTNHKDVDTLGLGVFDGLHLGHKVIAERCKWLLTFNPHPDVFLGKNKDLKMLTSVSELRYYVNNLLVFHFNKQFSKLSAVEFLNVIKEKFSPNEIVVGYDYKFGYKGEGNIHLLVDWASKQDITVVEIPPYKIDGNPVKSTEIRELICNNKLEKANRLLGHNYLVLGTVVKGEGRGHKFGFPTANIIPSKEKLLPVAGVYAGKAIVNRSEYECIIYVGKKPTFNGEQEIVEVHILNFTGDIYNRQLKVFFEKKIREDIKFDNVENLIQQINLDIIKAFPDYKKD